MADEPGMRFSSEELCLLAQLADEPTFPGIADPGLDEAGWSAVAAGLVARGVLSGRAEGEQVAQGTAAAIGIALFGDEVTSLAVGGPDSGRLISFYRQGGAVVEHEQEENGMHVLRALTVDRLPARLAQLVPLPEDDDASTAPGASLPLDEFAGAVRALADGDLAAACEAAPAASGYLAALSGSRAMTTVERRRREGDEVTAVSLTLVDGGTDQGLWLLELDEAEVEEDGVVVQRVSGAEGRRRLTALLV